MPGLRLSEIILRNMSAEAGMGHRAVASFVVNMATVFEDFVATALREALEPYPGLTEWQYEAFMDEAEPGYPSSDRVRMYVDVVHSVRGRPAMIFDAKYKAASAGGAYPNADHYQMLAYCTALGVPRAWLVYAGAGTAACSPCPKHGSVRGGVSAGSIAGAGGFAGASAAAGSVSLRKHLSLTHRRPSPGMSSRLRASGERYLVGSHYGFW